MKLAIIIPAFNEATVIADVIKSLPHKITGINDIIPIVIDDGSTDDTFEVAKNNTLLVIKHIINLGVGAATTTGFEVAKKIGADIVITIDGDGQHHSKDIFKLVQPILKKQSDVVIGTRMTNTKNMPVLKIFGNWLMNILTLLVYRQWSSDTQSGMKAMNKKAISKIVIHSHGYEFCSELIGEIKRNKLVMKEIPIETIYTNYSIKNGQNWLNGINILTKLISIKLFGEK